MTKPASELTNAQVSRRLQKAFRQYQEALSEDVCRDQLIHYGGILPPLKCYEGTATISFPIVIEATSEEDAEEQLSDLSIYGLARLMDDETIWDREFDLEEMRDIPVPPRGYLLH